MSKCSEASVMEVERQQGNFEKLIETVQQVSTVEIKTRRTKPLDENSTQKNKTDAAKDVAEAFRAVLETFQPLGNSDDNLHLLDQSVKILKKKFMPKKALDETTQSLIDHYETVTNPEIKRSLLAEISKQLSLSTINKNVKEKITKHK